MYMYVPAHVYLLLVDIPSVQVKNSRFKVFDRYLNMQVYLKLLPTACRIEGERERRESTYVNLRKQGS